MNVTLAVLADAANVSQEGKLNILGSFNTIMVENFPARHPAMVLVLPLNATPAEYGQVRDLGLKLLGADGEEHAAMQITIPVEAPPDLAIPHKCEAIVNVRDLVFPRAGDYAIHVLIGDDDKTQVPLRLVELPSQPKEENDEEATGG